MLPARDIYHDVVLAALQKEGWTIVADPLVVAWDDTTLFIDLAAQHSLEPTTIAVEIKSFIGPSEVADLEAALGQFLVYRAVLSHRKDPHVLWLAVSQQAFESIFQDGLGAMIRLEYKVSLLVIDVDEEEIVAWLR